MKSLAEQMAFYQRYHRNSRNKATHFVGVPAILLAVILALSWLRIGGGELSAAEVLSVALMIYYFRLDVPLAIASTIAFAVLLAIAHAIDSVLTASGTYIAFAVLFVGGWGAATDRPLLRGAANPRSPTTCSRC
ncbi:MAG: Mpo1-like protein [Pararobbsia sp.]